MPNTMIFSRHLKSKLHFVKYYTHLNHFVLILGLSFRLGLYCISLTAWRWGGLVALWLANSCCKRLPYNNIWWRTTWDRCLCASSTIESILAQLMWNKIYKLCLGRGRINTFAVRSKFIKLQWWPYKSLGEECTNISYHVVNKSYTLEMPLPLVRK